ncbi:MAG: RNA-binding protein [Candidatus Aenigmatarchaeota archaeon]|nr:MAG: RNA-binding protein [Candidatus Aenigmarchaeota archaeon]
MKLQTQYLIRLAEKGVRGDGRKGEEYRKIEIEKNTIAKAEGSAKVKIGSTEVVAGVKMDVGEPFPDKPDEGILITNAEFSPIASPEFETGPPDEDAIELARVVDRGIRESGAIDMKKLCITPGEKVWMVFIDIHILNHSGNLIDAAGLAAVTALKHTKIPEYDGEKVDYENKTKPLPLVHLPVTVTTAKIGNLYVVDPGLEEEDVMSVRLTVTTKEDGNVCAIQKSGPDGLLLEEVEKIFKLSIKKGNEIRKL